MEANGFIRVSEQKHTTIVHLKEMLDFYMIPLQRCEETIQQDLKDILEETFSIGDIRTACDQLKAER